MDAQGQNVTYDGEAHIATFAGTGGGKTTGCVIPNALRWSGSLIIIDPKASTANLSANYRSEVLGQDVFLLDPFKICDEDLVEFRASYNPMDEIPAGPGEFEPEAVRRAKGLASSLVFKAEGDNRYFTNQALNLLKGVILHVKTKKTLKGERTLLTVADQLADIEKLITAMKANKDDKSGIVKRVALQMENKAPRERSSIVSVAQESLEIFDDEDMADAVSHTTDGLDFSAMQERAQTYYLILPFEYLEDYSRYLRLLVTNILTAISGMPDTGEQGGAKDPMLFVLDEFANLGAELEIVKNAFSYIRSKNCRLWMLAQELSVVKRLYKDWEGMIANCGLLEAFAINSLTTSEFFSKLSGTHTVYYDTSSKSKSFGGSGFSATSGEGTTVKDEPFLHPHNVRWQDKRTKFMFPTGQKVQDDQSTVFEMLDQIRWYENETLKERVPAKYRTI